MTHQTPILPLWNRQAQLQRRMVEDRDIVYQISSVPKANRSERPTIIAMTSKISAQKIISEACANKDNPYLYKVSMFKNPSLPGLDQER